MIVFVNTIKLYIESKSAFQGSRPVWDGYTQSRSFSWNEVIIPADRLLFLEYITKIAIAGY